MKRPRRVFVPLLLCALVLLAVVVTPLLSPRQAWLPMGRARTSWQWVIDWHVGSRSARETEWDEPMEVKPSEPPAQVYQVRTEQFGPLVVETRRRVPPRPGEVTD